MEIFNKGFEYKKSLGPEAAGLRLIEYLTRCFPAFAREEWLERIHEGRTEARHHVVSPSLVVRSTTSAPPREADSEG